MQWSAVGTNKAAVVGFNAKGEFFNNHPQSETKKVGDAVSCAGLGRRQKRDIPGTGFICPLPGVDIIRDIVTNCTENIDYDPQYLRYWAEQLDPCPCTSSMAREDIGRFVKQNEMCYVSGRRLSIPNVTNSLTQQCCYDEQG